MKSSELTIKKKDRLIDKWKRKHYRLLKKTNPRDRDELLDGVKDIDRIGRSALRKQLLQAAAILKQLFDKRKSLKTNQEKSLFVQTLAGETLEKYKLMRSMSHIISPYLQRKYIKSKSIIISECIRNRRLLIIKERTIRLFLEQDKNSSISFNKKDFITKSNMKKR